MIQLRAQPLSRVVLALSLGAHGFGFLILRGIAASEATPLFGEATFCLFFSAGLAAAAHLHSTLAFFRVQHLLRLALMLAVIQAVESASERLELVLLLPFVLEAAVYDETPGAVVLSALAVGGLAGQAAFNLRYRESSILLGHIGSVATVGVLVSMVALLMAHYREELVAERRRSGDLTSSLLNLADANRVFLRYTGAAESESAARERQRIIRELHDIVGYALTNVIVMTPRGSCAGGVDAVATDGVDAFRGDVLGELRGERCDGEELEVSPKYGSYLV